MLLLVFRRSSDQDLKLELRKLDITSFTEAHKAFGMGKARGASACLPGQVITPLSQSACLRYLVSAYFRLARISVLRIQYFAG